MKTTFQSTLWTVQKRRQVTENGRNDGEPNINYNETQKDKDTEKDS